MRSESEVRARELLAATLRDNRRAFAADALMSGHQIEIQASEALEAIQAALASQGEQQVAGDALAMIGANLRSLMSMASEGAATGPVTRANMRDEIQHAQQLLAAALAARQPVGECGTCGEAIKSDVLTGTTCGCARIERSTESPKPVVTYCGRRLTPAGTRECWGYLSEAIDDLPRGTKLYTTPPAQPQAPAAAVPEASLLDKVRDESWGLVPFDMPTGGGDADVRWRVLEYHMAAPHERVVAEVYKDDPRAALEAAVIAAAPAPGVSNG